MWMSQGGIHELTSRVITETERKTLRPSGNPQLNTGTGRGIALLLALQDRGTIYVHHIGVTIKWSISILLLVQVCSEQERQIYFLLFIYLFIFPIKALLACEGLETLDFPRSRRY